MIDQVPTQGEMTIAVFLIGIVGVAAGYASFVGGASQSLPTSIHMMGMGLFLMVLAAAVFIGRRVKV